jgi:hypothetical protein
MVDDVPEAIALPHEVRELLAAPNYVHLSTLRRDGHPATTSSGWGWKGIAS